jgi:hypothetical protein
MSQAAAARELGWSKQRWANIVQGWTGGLSGQRRPSSASAVIVARMALVVGLTSDVLVTVRPDAARELDLLQATTPVERALIALRGIRADDRPAFEQALMIMGYTQATEVTHLD